MTALAVLTRDWRDSYFLNCDNKIRVEYEEYLSSHSFSPVSGIGQSPSLIERVSFGLLEDQCAYLSGQDVLQVGNPMGDPWHGEVWE